MRAQFSLRMRLVVLFVAAIVPLFALSIVQSVVGTKAALQRGTDNLQFAASLVAANQQRMVEATHQLLTAIVNSPDVNDGNGAACGRYLKELIKLLPIYGELGIIGVDGYTRCHGLDGSAAVYLGDRAYFLDAVARRNFVAGDFVVGRISGKPTFNFALPVLDKSGRVSYVVNAALNLVEIAKLVSDARLPPSAKLTIVDRNGIVIAAQPATSGEIGEKIPISALQDAVKTIRKGVSEGVDAEGRPLLLAFLPSSPSVDAAFFVTLSVPRELVVGPIQRQLLFELIALALVAFLGGWLAWMMGGRFIVQPIEEIFTATEQIKKGRLDVRVSTHRVGPSQEFTRIAEAFNRMAGALEQREQEQASELANSQQAYAALTQLQLTQATSYNEQRETQRKLLDARQLGRIGHWELSLVTGQLWVSDNLCGLIGVDIGAVELSVETVIRLIHPDDQTRFAKAQRQSQQERAELDIEYRIVTPAGDVRWVHQVGREIANETGQAVSRAGVVQDITARKQAELALAHSTDLLRRTGEMAMIGGWEFVFDGMRLTCSEQVLRLRDLDPTAILTSKEARKAYPKEARAVFDAAVKAASTLGTPWDLELPLVTATGRRIWVRSQGYGMMQDGKVTRLTGVLQDITANRRSLESLHLLETSIARLNDVVLITEADPLDEPGPRIVFVNDAFERQTGYSRAEVLGKSPRLLHGPKTLRSELDRIKAALKKGDPVRVELINYTKSGVEYWTELDIAPAAYVNGGFTHSVAVSRDITRRKLAEQAFIESEQRYTALFENALVPMWVTDETNYGFLTVNKAAVTSYGYSAEEFRSLTLFDIRPESEHESFRQQLGSTFRSQKSSSLHRRKDGSIFTVDVLSQPIQYAGREARFIVALDVTAQVKAEKAAQEHLYTLQRAADAAPAITWHQTLDGTMQEVADQARGVIGAHQAVVSYTHDKDWAKAIKATSMSEKYAAHQHFSESPDGGGMYALVCERNRAIRLTQAELEAHPLWRGWLAIPLIGRNGKNIGLLYLSDKYEGEFTQEDEYVATELAQLASIAIENALLLQEVSRLNDGLEQKVAERTVALSRQEALFRALAEQAPQVVWTANSQGKLNYLNRAWFNLAGGELKDWVGDQWFSIVHPEDVSAVKANWALASASQSPYAGIRRLLAKDGSYHTMSYRATPVLDEHGDLAFWVGIDADITEIKAIEAALRLSNQELESFSYSVSHDLRSPLNTIDGFSRLLEKRLEGKAGDPDGKLQHYLSRIQVGVAQMGQLIDGLLTLAQVSRTQLLYEPVDLSALAHQILEECQARNPERLVKLHIESSLKAHGHERLIRVVMENLLLNAWKFTSHQDHAVIRVGQQFDAAALPVFFVSDNGAGFDMAYADKLFSPFQRLHAVSEFPGTGIGLATVGRVIGRHGGRIWAESAPGQGATFFFTLPQVPFAI